MPEPSRPALLLGHGAGAWPPAQLPQALAALPTPARERRVDLWLHSSLVLTLLAEAGARFADSAAATAWAQRVWSEYDEPPVPDAARTVAAVAWRSGPAHQGALGVSWLADTGLLGTAGAALAAAGRRPGHVAPLWAAVLACWVSGPAAPRGPARLLVAEGGRLVCIDRDGQGRLVGWQVWMAVPPEAAAVVPPGGVWLAGHGLPAATRATLHATVGPVHDVAALGDAGQDSAALLHALSTHLSVRPWPDFGPGLAASAGRARAAGVPLRLAGLALVTAALVLAVAGHEAWQAQQARAQAAARLAALAGRAEPPSAPPAAAQARLAQPWAQRFAVAEAAAPRGGGWLTLEQRSGPGPLLLSGLSDDAAEALVVAQRLLAQPGVADAQVLRSEALAAGAGTPAAEGVPRVRFDIGLSWQPGLR